MFSYVWKNVVFGEIESEDYIVSHSGCIQNSSSNEVIKQYKKNDGEMYVDLEINNKLVQCKVDVIVISSHFRKPFINETINHMNGNKSDCGMMNLECIKNVQK